MPLPSRASGIALALSALLAACGGGGGDGTPVSQPMDLTILHLNDHHSTLDGKSRTLQLKTSAGATAPSAVTVDAAGFPRVTQAMAELSAQSAHVLKLHAGDALTGTLYFNRAGAPWA